MVTFMYCTIHLSIHSHVCVSFYPMYTPICTPTYLVSTDNTNGQTDTDLIKAELKRLGGFRKVCANQATVIWLKIEGRY